MTRKLELGGHGEMSVTAQKRDGGGRWRTAANVRQAERWRARVYYRAHDGEVRSVSGFGRKRAEAESVCEQNLQSKLSAHGSRFTTSTLFVVVGNQWLEYVKRPDSGKAPRTILDYERSFARHIDVAGSMIRGLTLKQVNNAQTIRLFLEDVADRTGTGSAKTAKSVLSNVLTFGVDNGVLEANACRSVRPVRSTNTRRLERDTGRAFTDEELRHVVDHARHQASPDARNPRSLRARQATADMIEFMASTGVRIGEARALRWSDIDLKRKRVVIRGTKSKSAERALNLPAGLIKTLKTRAKRDGKRGYVFSSPGVTDPDVMWDQSNNAQALKTAIHGAGFAWATPHTFRRTVATRLHASGIQLVRISDQLGHADPAMTMTVYLGRDLRGDKADIAAVLDLGDGTRGQLRG